MFISLPNAIIDFNSLTFRNNVKNDFFYSFFDKSALILGNKCCRFQTMQEVGILSHSAILSDRFVHIESYNHFYMESNKCTDQKDTKI